MKRRFTGWHMLASMIAFFGVVIGVNVTMARIAIGSFGGMVVENSYVASQEFNTWLEEARGQEALGWQVDGSWQEDGHYVVNVAGAPDPLTVVATARHPLGGLPDRPLTFDRDEEGRYLSVEELPRGRWIMRLQVKSAEDEWRSEIDLPQ